LQATALVNEAYLRLFPGEQVLQFRNRRHFFGAAAEAMRRILVDQARRKRREKRGGDLRRTEFDPDKLIVTPDDARLLALNEALDRFANHAPDKAELVKLHRFGGLSLDAAAEVLDISSSTADRWWAYARAWLRMELEEKNLD
jgi:RNA polymerase sigma factor (TIGR02999 family)